MIEQIQNAMKWPRSLEEREGLILYSLKNYQIIETILKNYISLASPGNTKNSSKTLGQLIPMFYEINKNEDLRSLLLTIKDERNNIAHQALVTSNPVVAKSLGVTEFCVAELREMNHRASDAMTQVICEYLMISNNPAQSPTT
jgi:hypothetical protein